MKFTVPLCAIHRHNIHTTGKEKEWWQERKIDPLKVAGGLWQKSREGYSGTLKTDLSKSLELEAKDVSADDRGPDTASANGREPVEHRAKDTGN